MTTPLNTGKKERPSRDEAAWAQTRTGDGALPEGGAGILATTETREYIAGDKDAMSLEERVLFMEFLVESLIWGPHLDDKAHRQTIAAHLYTCVEASERHRAHPPAVQRALLRYADGLAGIDNIPDALKPTLRPTGQPTSNGER